MQVNKEPLRGVRKTQVRGAWGPMGAHSLCLEVWEVLGRSGESLKPEPKVGG